MDDRRISSRVAIVARVHSDFVNKHRTTAPATLEGLGLLPETLLDPPNEAALRIPDARRFSLRSLRNRRTKRVGQLPNL